MPLRQTQTRAVCCLTTRQPVVHECTQTPPLGNSAMVYSSILTSLTDHASGHQCMAVSSGYGQLACLSICWLAGPAGVYLTVTSNWVCRSALTSLRERSCVLTLSEHARALSQTRQCRSTRPVRHNSSRYPRGTEQPLETMAIAQSKVNNLAPSLQE